MLHANAIGSAGARAVASSPHLSNLRTLDLSLNGIDADGAAALAASPHLARLTLLDLNGNRIGNAGVRRPGRIAPPGQPAAPPSRRKRPRQQGRSGAGVVSSPGTTSQTVAVEKPQDHRERLEGAPGVALPAATDRPQQGFPPPGRRGGSRRPNAHSDTGTR